MKTLTTIVILVVLTGCDHMYTKTYPVVNDEVLSARNYVCEFGVLYTHRHERLTDINGKLIPCINKEVTP